ncbi:MAG: tetratricopeptide repeat-containing sensor histidine kinase [bacterium]
MKKIKSTILLILLFSSVIFSQYNSNTIDSLEIKAKTGSVTEIISCLNKLSTVYISKDPQKSILAGKTAYTIAITNKDYNSANEALLNIGNGFNTLQIYDSAIVYLKKAIKNYNNYSDKKVFSQLYINLGLSYERLYIFSQANVYYHDALNINRSLKDTLQIAYCLSCIGLNYWRVGDYLESEKYNLEALDLRKKINNKKAISVSLTNIGILHWNWGNYFKALKYYLEAINIKEEIKDSIGLVFCSNNLGILYQKFGDLEKTKSYYYQSLEISNKINYAFGKAYSAENIGNYCFEQKIYNEADNYYQKALELYISIKHKNGQSNVYNSMGKLYYQLGKYQEAKDFHLKAYTLAVEVSDRKAVAGSLINLGRTYQKLGNLDIAESYIYNSLDLLKKDKIPDLIKDAYNYLSEIKEKENNHKAAFYYLKLYREYSDSLYGGENLRRIMDLKEKYENDRREKENEILRSQTTRQEFEIKKQNYAKNMILFASFVFASFTAFLFYSNRLKKRTNKQILLNKKEVDKLNEELSEKNDQLSNSENNLQELNSTKDKFFSIIAHDLRNPFMSILGFLDLLTNSYNEYDEDDKKQMLTNTTSLALNTYKLLENLLQWSRLQTDGISFYPRKLDLTELIKEAIESLRPTSNLKNINLIFQNSNKIEFICDEEMLNSVFRNIISNSIKFTPSNGNITIDLVKTNLFIVITITDTGIGMDENALSNLFKVGQTKSRKGTQGEKGTGIGLLLAGEFINKHQGSINVKSEVGKGTSFIISLPELKNN